jgi:hypothetical protein
MASTRNKNTPGNYALEQEAYAKQYLEKMYIHSPQGKAQQTVLPGDGLLIGKMHGRDLASNSCDIESFLWGIGSTNLVNPLPKVEPLIHSLPSLNVIHRVPLVRPLLPPKVDTLARPMYLN